MRVTTVTRDRCKEPFQVLTALDPCRMIQQVTIDLYGGANRKGGEHEPS
jgi:hypothetical protein